MNTARVCLFVCLFVAVNLNVNLKVLFDFLLEISGNFLPNGNTSSFDVEKN